MLYIDAKCVLGDFEEEYPLEYIDYCGVSTVGQHDDSVTESEGRAYCIYVKLVVPLPPGCYIPDEYKGLRVFIDVIQH